MMLEMIAGIMFCILIVYLLYIYWYLPKQQKQMGQLVRILLFEQVGNDKLFRGFYHGVEESDEKLGVYIMISKIKKAVSQVNATDFFPDKDFQRCLLVCKYSDDDYRSMSRMKTNEWLKKIDLPQEDYLETEEIKEEDEEGNKITRIQLKTDDEGNYIQRLDKDNNPLPDYTFTPYEEPIGVTQGAREAMRFNRSFVQRMREKRAAKNTFWDKYGTFFLTGALVILMVIGNAYSNNKMADTVTYAIDKFGEKSDEIIKSTNSPDNIQKIMDMIEKKQTQQNAPNK